jgi:type IV pilus assembly protein PilA
MLKLLKKRLSKREDGFTLIELLVVVVIIGILIGIAIPVYLNYRKSANDKSAQSDLRGAVSTLEVCNSDTGGYPTSWTPPAAPCTGQSVTVSSGTTMAYEGTASSYKLVSTNSNGTTNKYFCYNSATGGSVRALSATYATSALALAACT